MATQEEIDHKLKSMKEDPVLFFQQWFKEQTGDEVEFTYYQKDLLFKLFHKSDTNN